MLLFLFVNVSLSQYSSRTDWVRNILDARSIGMGRTSIVNSISANCIFSNPSHLTKIEQIQFDVGARVVTGTLEDMYRKEYYQFYESSLYPQYSFSHIAISVPFNLPFTNIRLASGFGYGLFYDFGNNYKDSKKTDDISSSYELQNRGGFDIYNISVGYAFNEYISSALSYRWSWDNKFHTKQIFDNHLTRIYTTNHFSSYISLGLIFSLPAALKVGIVYSPEFLWGREQYIIKHIGTGLEEINSSPSYRIPRELGIGTDWNPTSYLTFAFEYDWIEFSKLNFDNPKNPASWHSNGDNKRIGIEYGKNYKIRIGYYLDSIPVSDENSIKPIVQQGITGGMGFSLFKAQFDIAVDYHNWELNRFHDNNLYTNNYERFKILINITKNFTK